MGYLFFFLFLVNDSVNNRNRSDVYDIAYGSFTISEMDRFVQSHLYRADYLSFTHRLNELVGSIGGT